jgi:hypothetical protein
MADMHGGVKGPHGETGVGCGRVENWTSGEEGEPLRGRTRVLERKETMRKEKKERLTCGPNNIAHTMQRCRSEEQICSSYSMSQIKISPRD